VTLASSRKLFPSWNTARKKKVCPLNRPQSQKISGLLRPVPFSQFCKGNVSPPYQSCPSVRGYDITSSFIIWLRKCSDNGNQVCINSTVSRDLKVSLNAIEALNGQRKLSSLLTVSLFGTIRATFRKRIRVGLQAPHYDNIFCLF